MKHKINLKVLLLATLALFGAHYVNAEVERSHDADGHAAEHKNQGGPNGGRMITSVKPHLEFLVTAERFVQITFIGHHGEVLPVGDQVVSAIGGERSSPTKIEFVEKKGTLFSKEALPEMKAMPIVLQVKSSPDAKAVRERFYLNMHDCSGCDFQEYACICGH